jgi:putative transposase
MDRFRKSFTMSTSAFEKGAIVEIDGRAHQLLRKLEGDLWQVEDSRTKRIVELTERELHKSYVAGKLRFAQTAASSSVEPKKKPLVDYGPERWERAKVRRAYVVAVLDVPNNRTYLNPIIHETWRKLRQPANRPDAATVMRWKAKYLAAGQDITALIEQNERKGNVKSRHPREVEEIVEHAIDAKYMTRERGTIQDVIDKAQADVRQENILRPEAIQLPLPTRRLVKRLIEAIPAFDRCEARYGRTVAVKRFRSVQGHRTTNAPLERTEMDHSLFDLMVIDDATYLPLGRPWLTGCIDDYTRNALGVFMSFEPPSYFTVARCLKQAILPKVWLKDEYPSIKNTWDAHGVMRELVVDNGTEFHSESLENACYSLGIEVHYAPRKTPWFKGKIERFLGTLNRGVAHGAPGTTFRGILEKEEYDPSKQAVVRYSVLKEMLYTWIVDVYHQKPHRALHAAPATMWAKSIASDQILLPDDPARLDAILGRSEVRCLTHKGIELDGLFYNSPELTALRRKLGDKIDVEVRVDAADIGKIVVLSPDRREMYSVAALRSDYATGLSAWQHRICKRYAARELEKYSLDTWLEAKERIAEMIDAEFAHRKLKTRTRMARYQGDAKLLGRGGGAKASGRPPPPESSPDPMGEAGSQTPAPVPANASESAVSPLPSSPPAAAESAPMPASRRFKPVYRERSPATIAQEDA